MYKRQEASYEEYKANLRRNAKNFRITDEHLGEGGPKAKFQANVNAICLLKELEAARQQASPEQQEVLSRYVGWGAPVSYTHLGKTYDATVVLEDDGQYVNFKLEFDQRKGGSR